MKKFIILLALMLSSMAAMAEEKVDTVIITLQNGTEVRYTSDQFDRVQIIYSLKYGVKVYLKNGKSKDYLASKVVVAQYQQGGEVVTDTNRNRNLYRAKLLEYPHLAADSTMNQLVIKSTSDYGITFSLEWSYADKANRWTCYQLHEGNKNGNAGRNDSFREDPEIPAQYRSTLADYKGSGFSRGHLCPSSDRQCSVEQNKQTFFLSNMQPQWQKHNGEQWADLESDVRKWAARCDTLYVVKAATIDNVTLNGNTEVGVYSTTYNGTYYEDLKCNGRLLVAKYYYMALLAYNKSSNTYQAMGIWTKHYNGGTTGASGTGSYDWPVINRESAQYITIEELEQRTGIDFFCNLPDDIEVTVESTLNTTYWSQGAALNR